MGCFSSGRVGGGEEMELRWRDRIAGGGSDERRIEVVVSKCGEMMTVVMERQLRWLGDGGGRLRERDKLISYDSP